MSARRMEPQIAAQFDKRYPKLTAWLARIHARPAYARALARGGPYSVIG
jgi:glutathione S-transferase